MRQQPGPAAMEHLTIGKTAHEAGVSVETIRYYQRIGLIAEPEKPLQGFRRYPPDTVARIRFIKRAQQLGFSLGDIGEMLRLGDGNCAEVERMASLKYRQIGAQIRDLKRLQSVLGDLLEQCRRGRDEARAGCPLVRSIVGSE